MSKLQFYVRYTDEGVIVPSSLTGRTKPPTRQDRLSGMKSVRSLKELYFPKKKLRAFLKPTSGGYANLILRSGRPAGRWIEIPYELSGAVPYIGTEGELVTPQTYSEGTELTDDLLTGFEFTNLSSGATTVFLVLETGQLEWDVFTQISDIDTSVPRDFLFKARVTQGNQVVESNEAEITINP